MPVQEYDSKFMHLSKSLEKMHNELGKNLHLIKDKKVDDKLKKIVNKYNRTKRLMDMYPSKETFEGGSYDPNADVPGKSHEHNILPVIEFSSQPMDERLLTKEEIEDMANIGKNNMPAYRMRGGDASYGE